MSDRWSKTGVGLATEGDTNPSLAPGIYYNMHASDRCAGGCKQHREQHSGFENGQLVAECAIERASVPGIGSKRPASVHRLAAV